MKTKLELKKLILDDPSIENMNLILNELKMDKSVMIPNWHCHTIGNMTFNNEFFAKLKSISSIIGEKKSDGVIVTNDLGQTCLFYLLYEGKNGNGDFVKDDMKNVFEKLSEISDNGLRSSIKDIKSDSLDDVSTWCVLTWLEI